MANILVVEDNRDWQKAIQKVLERDGHKVTIAASQDKARAILKSIKAEHRFALVVMDLRLKGDWSGDFIGMELLELTDKLAEEEDTKVIILTAYGTEKQARDALVEHKVGDFLSKREFGTDGAPLRDAVRRLLTERERERWL